MLLVWLAAGAATWAVSAYYRREFGFQRDRKGSPREAWMIATGFGCLYAMSWGEVEFGLPVSAIGLGWAAIFLLFFRTSPRLRWHYGAAAAVLLLAGLVPLTGAATAQQLFGQWSRLGGSLVGGSLAACGLLDHLLLRRLLAPGLSNGYAG